MHSISLYYSGRLIYIDLSFFDHMPKSFPGLLYLILYWTLG